MNWKTLLVRGLPVVLIAAVIILIAVIAGRPKPLPKVENGNETVISFKDLKIDKTSLYEMMKQNGGLTELLNTVDNSLLAGYQSQVDTAARDKEITDAKTTQGEDTFYKNMTNLGVILGKDDPERDAKITAYYNIKYLQKAYARQVAVNALKPEDVQTAINNYKPDLCILTLKYTVKADADAETAKLNALTGTAVFTQFETDWDAQNPNGVTNPELPSFLQGLFTCSYQLAEYNSYSASNADLRDFIFSPTFNDQPFGVGNYNKAAKLIGTNYYVIYKFSQAPAKESYDQTKFTEYITKQLLGNTVTDTYVQTQVKKLRSDNSLKIYDTKLATQYASAQTGFKAEKHLLDKTTVATYKLNGETKKVSAEDLYKALKPEYAVQTILDKINYAALKSIKEIQLTKTELASYTDQVKSLKTQFLSSGYGQYISWPDYIAAYYGAFSESELADKFASQELSKRYMLGKDGYVGADPVTQADIDEAYAKWFSIQASHIFFTFTPSDTAGVKSDTQLLAEEKAGQVIYGCTTDGKSRVPNSTADCEIKYNNTWFAGLEHIDASTYGTVFAALASTYSDDTGSKTKGGDLGYFGPGQMVPEFENAAKEIASRGVNSFSVLPVESTVKTADTTLHGYHVILVTGVKDKVEKPANYDTITDPAKSTDTAVKAYYNFIQTIKTDLEGKHTTSDNYAKVLADLRETLGVTINDPDIKAHYDAITALQKAYDRTKDTDTPTNE